MWTFNRLHVSTHAAQENPGETKKDLSKSTKGSIYWGGLRLPLNIEYFLDCYFSPSPLQKAADVILP